MRTAKSWSGRCVALAAVLCGASGCLFEAHRFTLVDDVAEPDAMVNPPGPDAMEPGPDAMEPSRRFCTMRPPAPTNGTVRSESCLDFSESSRPDMMDLLKSSELGEFRFDRLASGDFALFSAWQTPMGADSTGYALVRGRGDGFGRYPMETRNWELQLRVTPLAMPPSTGHIALAGIQLDARSFAVILQRGAMIGLAVGALDLAMPSDWTPNNFMPLISMPPANTPVSLALSVIAQDVVPPMMAMVSLREIGGSDRRINLSSPSGISIGLSWAVGVNAVRINAPARFHIENVLYRFRTFRPT